MLPLIVTVTYVPLFIVTLRSRPWQRQHRLFILLLVPAAFCGVLDYLFRSSFLPAWNALLLKGMLLAFFLTAVQLHCFTSSFFGPGQGRWLPFAYVSLVLMAVLTLLGWVPGDTSHGVRYTVYGWEMLVLASPLVVLLARNVWVFGHHIKTADLLTMNRESYLLVGVAGFTASSFLAFAWLTDFPVVHLGNLFSAAVLSYGAVRTRPTDISLFLKRSAALITLAVVGVGIYWLFVAALGAILQSATDVTSVIAATLAALLAGLVIYMSGGAALDFIGRLLEGDSYTCRRRAAGSAARIQDLFGLREQGGELLTLLMKATSCPNACLLLPDGGGAAFSAQVVKPDGDEGLSSLRLSPSSPLLQDLQQDKHLTAEDIQARPEMRAAWDADDGHIRQSGAELLVPLVSREQLVAVMALGKKESGRYLLDDIDLLKDLARRVAVPMEKEYLRAQLRAREQELIVTSRAASFICSSLDVQSAFGSSIKELTSLLEVHWAAIVLLQDSSLYFMAAWADGDTIWQVGERVSSAGMMTDVVVETKEALYVPDLSRETRFPGLQRFSDRLKSVLCLPLVGRGGATGSLYVAAHRTNAYNQRQISLLGQLASQIAMPVENAWLYAKTQEMARVDQLTGLLNRRSFDEMLVNEIRRCSRYGGIFSIIILDLDSLKAYNDTYGHVAGDKLIKQIGTSIKTSIRVVDYAFRYGGDEFAVLLPQTPTNAAAQVAERIRKRVLQIGDGQSGYDYASVPVTASLGLAMWPVDGAGQNEIIAAADDALYQAKRKGGNMVLSVSGPLAHFRNVVAGLGGNKDERALSTIYALWAKLDARAHNSHSEKVSEYTSTLARALNMDPGEVVRLETCALLHDIGKVVISDEILNKHGDLTPQEWDLVKAHPQLGANIASLCQLGTCVAGIRHHHEWYDGTGYPDGLKGDQIPLEARILAIADAFAAMTSERSYSNALTLEAALHEIKDGSGKQFDPRLADVFVLLFKNTDVEEGGKKPGSVSQSG